MDFPDLKLKAVVNFPANAFGRTGINVARQNGAFFIDIDYSEFSIVTSASASSYVLNYDPVSQAYSLSPAVTGASAASNSNPVMNGVAAPGILATYSRGDHVHPTDTSLALKTYVDSQDALKAPINAPILTGDAKSTNPPAGDNDNSIATTQFVTAAISTIGGGVVRSHLAGLALSTAGSSATFSVAPGVAADSTSVAMLALATTISKTTAAWAVGSGNGSFDGTGAAPSATADWYHAYLIKRTDTGVVDVLTSRSATAPTMPASYTLFRRIGSMKTSGAFQWTAFIQNGDSFRWISPLRDVTATNPGTSAVLATLSLPTGVVVEADIAVLIACITSTSIYVLVTNPTEFDTTPSGAGLFTLAAAASGTGLQVGMPVAHVFTNTSGQVRYRLSVSGASDVLVINTFGWIDRRGRDA